MYLMWRPRTMSEVTRESLAFLELIKPTPEVCATVHHVGGVADIGVCGAWGAAKFALTERTMLQAAWRLHSPYCVHRALDVRVGHVQAHKRHHML